MPRIGLRENLHETHSFGGEIHGFVQMFPSTNSGIHGTEVDGMARRSTGGLLLRILH